MKDPFPLRPPHFSTRTPDVQMIGMVISPMLFQWVACLLLVVLLTCAQAIPAHGGDASPDTTTIPQHDASAAEHDASSAAASPQSEEEMVKTGTAALEAGDFTKAREIFSGMETSYPDNPIPHFFLGEIALQEDQYDMALRQWKIYQAKDPGGAEELGVARKIATVENLALKNQYKLLFANEERISQQPPEPNTIAVMPFGNTGDPTYDALAKGLTAMVITDLAKIKSVKILEREKIEKLLEEISLNDTGLVQDHQVRAGKLLRAERIMNGSFSVK